MSTTSFVVLDELKRLEDECTKLTSTLRTLFDARPSTKTQMEDASVKLRTFMDAIESMKNCIRSNENGSEEIELWKQRRAQLKANYEKLAAEFESRDKADTKDGASELTEEERRVMSGRAPPPVVQNRLLELATAPKTPVPEQRTFEPAPLKQPTKHQKKSSRSSVPVQLLTDAPELDNHLNNGRSHSAKSNSSGAPLSTTTVVPVLATSSTGSHKVAPANPHNPHNNNNGDDSRHPPDQPAASGCCVIL